MIHDQWYVVLESKQVKNRPIGVTRLGEKLVFWRDDSGQVSCVWDKCPHRGVALSKGQVVDGHVQCPFHGFEYDTTGQAVYIPANGQNVPVPKAFRVQSYPTYEAHGFIWIWWGHEPPQELGPPRFFEHLDDSYRYATVYDPWPTHYSRVIENQLDVVHLPFVHRKTIGKGTGKVVDGPGILWVDDSAFHVYLYNREDDGTPPRKPSQVPVPRPDTDFHLEFVFPNLWLNYFGEQACLVAAFVPVDEENTLLYLRFYQKFLSLPLLGDAAAWLSMPFNRRIAHEDRRIVVTHQPPASGLRIGERMIQGDRPIVEYRRRREELQAVAAQRAAGSAASGQGEA